MANLLQINYEDEQCDDTFVSLSQPGVDFTQATFKLGQTEFHFDFNPLAKILVVLFTIRFLVLFWST